MALSRQGGVEKRRGLPRAGRRFQDRVLGVDERVGDSRTTFWGIICNNSFAVYTINVMGTFYFYGGVFSSKLSLSSSCRYVLS